MRVLIPVDGSWNALQAVRQVIAEAQSGPPMEVHLLNVQLPLPRHAARFVSRQARGNLHRERGVRALESACRLLADAGIACVGVVEVGAKAQTIVAYARETGCQRIVLGTGRKNLLTRLACGSVMNRVVELAPVPVEVVAGRPMSSLEKFGLPAGLGLGFALLLLAAEG